MRTDKVSSITIKGARVNNLKNIDVEIPRNRFVVVTGLSGSVKSSLAFDTIFAEGQRRYIETFSAYARNMLGNLERPDVDSITGLCPVIAIEQKTVNRNPRSTIGTTTEIYDFLRLLYARIGHARSYISGMDMVKYTDEKIVDLINERYDGHKIYLLAPLVKNRKGHYKELFEQLLKKGYLNVRVDGELTEISRGMRLDRYKNHSIELVIDRVKVNGGDNERLLASVVKALEQGEKEMMVYDVDADEAAYYSQELMDPATGISYHDPAPHNFSFNSPQGMCPRCKGLGYVNIIDRSKIVPDENISIYQGALVPLGKYRDTVLFMQLRAILEANGYTLKTPFKDLSDDVVDEIFNGTASVPRLNDSTVSASDFFRQFAGVVKFIENMTATSRANGAASFSHVAPARSVMATVSTKKLCIFLSTAKISPNCAAMIYRHYRNGSIHSVAGSVAATAKSPLKSSKRLADVSISLLMSDSIICNSAAHRQPSPVAKASAYALPRSLAQSL